MSKEIIALERRIQILEQENEAILKKNCELVASHEIFKLIVENMSETVILADYQGKILFVCPNCMTIFGLTTEEVQGKGTIDNLVGKIDFKRKELFDSKEINNIEASVADKSGNPHTILINIKCVDMMNGSLLYVMRDISDIKQASVELSRSYESFYKVVDMLPQFVAYTDTDLRYRFVNATYMKEFGLSAEELIGLKLPDVIGQEAFERALPFVEKALSGEKVHYQVRYNYPGGNVRDIDGQLLPDIGENGQVEGYYAILTDITSFVAIQETLKETKHQLLSLFNNLPGAPFQYVLTPGGDYRFDFMGDKVEELFGLKPAEVLNDPNTLFELIPPPDADFVQRAIEQSARTLSPYEVDHRIVRKSGETIWVHAASIPRKLNNGNIVWDGIVLDITERRLAENNLELVFRDLLNRQKIAKLFLTAPQDSLFQDILKIFLHQFSCTFGYLGYLDENGDLVCPSMTHEVWHKCAVAEKSVVFPESSWGGAWGESLKKKRSVLQNQGLKPPEGHISIDNVLAVPLLVDRQLVGQIALANKQGGFSLQDQHRLESYAEFIAPVLQIYNEKERAFMELQASFNELEGKNIALNVLMDNRAEEKKKMSGTILDSFDKLVFPYFGRIKKYQHKEDLLTILKIIESNTRKCLQSLEKNQPPSYRTLTSKELQVADLIRAGKTSKQIAEILNTSLRSVFFHRNNIRRKLGIHKTKTNLRSFLTSQANT